MANLSDIAKREGLSASTISRVLNHDSTMSVSQDNREAIFAVAAELDYMTPRGRRRQARPMQIEPLEARDQVSIALLHYLNPEQELSLPYLVSMRIGIETAALRQKFHLIRIFPEDGRLSLQALVPAAGAVIVGHRSPDEMKMIAEIYPKRVYSDLLRKYPSESDVVEVDLTGPSMRLIDDLVQRGYKRIGYVGWAEAGSEVFEDRRVAALTGRMRELGIFAAERMALGEVSLAGAVLSARRLLNLPEPPDVIIAGTDNLAMGVYRAAFEMGVSVPTDLAVVGYNDNPYSAFMTPALSTIGIPASIIGSTAVDLLAEQLEGRATPKRVIFEGRMIWRESTR
jgi:LacI family transcriptional regulator